jgi:hypothetical protein
MRDASRELRRLGRMGIAHDRRATERADRLQALARKTGEFGAVPRDARPSEHLADDASLHDHGRFAIQHRRAALRAPYSLTGGGGRVG